MVFIEKPNIGMRDPENQKHPQNQSLKIPQQNQRTMVFIKQPNIGQLQFWNSAVSSRSVAAGRSLTRRKTAGLLAPGTIVFVTQLECVRRNQYRNQIVRLLYTIVSGRAGHLSLWRPEWVPRGWLT
jgi:hypothetical protein